MNTPAAAEPERFTDLSGLNVARRIYWGRWTAAAFIVLALLALARAFAHGQIEWSVVGRFLTVPVILTGIVNSVVMAVAAMALGIVLGLIVAVMRLTSNPVLQAVAGGYTWLFRGTPVILQLLLWFNLALVFPVIGLPAASQCTLLQATMSAGKEVLRLVPTRLPHRSAATCMALAACT